MPQEKDPKWTKKETAYVEPKSGNPTCGRCLAYYNKKCTLVKGTIDPINGSCALWGERRTIPIKGKTYKPWMSKEASGYVETDKGPRCGTCVFYKDPRRCGKVYGDIDPIKGCCNLWKK